MSMSSALSSTKARFTKGGSPEVCRAYVLFSRGEGKWSNVRNKS